MLAAIFLATVGVINSSDKDRESLISTDTVELKSAELKSAVPKSALRVTTSDVVVKKATFKNMVKDVVTQVVTR